MFRKTHPHQSKQGARALLRETRRDEIVDEVRP